MPSLPAIFSRPPTLAPGRRFAAAGLAALLALAIAACGSSPSAPSAASSVAAASPSPTPNLHGAPALEALLPSTLNGAAISKLSMTGADFLAVGPEQGRAELTQMLQQLGRSVADLSVAETYDPKAAATDQAAIFQVRGADPARLLALWVAAQQNATSGQTKVTDATVAGRKFTRLEDQSQSPAAVSYVTSSGDSLYIVATSDEKVVQQAIAAMLPG